MAGHKNAYALSTLMLTLDSEPWLVAREMLHAVVAQMGVHEVVSALESMDDEKQERFAEAWANRLCLDQSPRGE